MIKKFFSQIRADLLVFLIISIIGLIIYSNTFGNAFVFDDLETIVANPIIKNIHNIRGIFRYVPSRFITYLTFAANFQLGGLNVSGYHLFNLFIHILTAFTVFLFVRSLQKTPLIDKHNLSKYRFLPLLTALLFLVHPIQTQAVSYITQRTTSLAALFYLSSMVCYLKARSDKLPNLSFFLSLTFALLALYSKENTYSLPAIVFLIEFIFFPKTNKLRQKLLLVAPYVIVVILAYYANGFIQGITKADIKSLVDRAVVLPDAVQDERLSRGDYFFTQINVIRTYIRLLILPLNQNLDYDYPLSHTFWELKTILSAASLLLIFSSALFLLKKQRLIAFGILFFFITLLLESSIFPIADVIFEHRLYLPSVGFVIAVTAGLFEINRYVILIPISIGRRIPLILRDPSLTFRMTVYIPYVLLLISFSIMTYQRNIIWKDEYSLWNDVVKKSPRKARPHYNLGMAYMGQNRSDEAISQFKKAIEVDPLYLRAYNNLGASYEKYGKFGEAIEAYRGALRSDPLNSMVRDNLAGALFAVDRTNEAIIEYQKVLAIAPDMPQAYNGLGTIYAHQGKMDLARQSWQKAIEIDPVFDKPYYNLGLISYVDGRYEEAKGWYQKTLALNPDYAQAYFDSGLILTKEGKRQEAEKFIKVGASLDHPKAGEYLKLGLEYLKEGKKVLARHELEVALLLDPYLSEAKEQLNQMK